MFRRYDVTILAGLMGIMLVFTSACTKSIQANSGSKSFEQGATKRAATTASVARPSGPTNGPASSGASRQPAGSGSSAFGGNDFGKEPAFQEPATPVPSLSNIDAGQSSSNERASAEQRIPSDIVVAKTEPADAARRRVEEMQHEQMATAAAGLEDVYFGFDTWQISNEGKQALMMNAEWMKANANKTVMIEGHCDERGTLAYNLVLGEKRAKAVQKYLTELGVPGNRLKVVSYGKERPFCKEHDETCYQLNRRGHIVLRAQ